MQDENICVLQVLPALTSGGVERGAVDVAIALKNHGFKSLVASGGGPLVAILDRHHIKHIALPLYSKNPITMLVNAFLLARAINIEKVNVVHARSRGPGVERFPST